MNRPDWEEQATEFTQEIIRQLIAGRMKANLSQSKAVSLVKYNHPEIKLDPSYLSRIEQKKVALPLRTLLALIDSYELPYRSVVLQDEDHQPADLEWLMTPESARQFKKLADLLGPETAREKLLQIVIQFLFLLDAPNARPDSKEGTQY